MIRAETESEWLLITHPDHAKLAGEFADVWGNREFGRPEPYEAIRYAVYHHDDGWTNRDASPCLTPTGVPEAFTRDLVGAYSAFEEIDLPSYLRVRGEATAAVAAQNPAAGIMVSMHTVNLLTEQADESTIKPDHRAAHAEFVARQQAWQKNETAKLGLDADAMQRGFEFLQACDNLSLIACSGYDETRPLRHLHLDQGGHAHSLICRWISTDTWGIDPWPFSGTAHEFTLPMRRVSKSAFDDLPSYREAFARAEIEMRTIRIVSS